MSTINIWSYLKSESAKVKNKCVIRFFLCVLLRKMCRVFCPKAEIHQKPSHALIFVFLDVFVFKNQVPNHRELPWLVRKCCFVLPERERNGEPIIWKLHLNQFHLTNSVVKELQSTYRCVAAAPSDGNL